MPIVMKTGGGGGKLVKRFSAAPTAATKENTIGVVTETPMNGYVLQAEQPTGSEGLVWIKTASASDVGFQLGQVWIYPSSAQQYVNGAWTKIDAYIYQDGAWVLFARARFHLYNKGDECTDITGGWKSYAYTAQDGYSKGTLTKKTSSILLSTDADDFRNNIMVRTTSKIDVTNYSKININVLSRSGYKNVDYEGCFMFLHTGTSTETDASSASIKVGISKSGTFSIDLSKVSGSYYIRLECYGATVEFDEVWLDE